MSNTINLSSKYQKWVYIFNGIVYSAIGSRIFYQMDSLSKWEIVLGIILIACGPFMILYGLLLFWSSPIFRVNENFILIKQGLFRKQLSISWDEIKEITYKPYELEFLLSTNSTKSIHLKTEADTSLIIKRTIRKYADEKRISIVGG